MNLFIYLACIVIALRFIFIFRIWSFVFEYVVVRWQGENGKEARKIVFCSLVFRVIFNFRNLQWPAYIGEEDYHASIDENGSLYIVLYLFSNWSCEKFLTKRNDKNETLRTTACWHLPVIEMCAMWFCEHSVWYCAINTATIQVFNIVSLYCSIEQGHKKILLCFARVLCSNFNFN